MTNPGAFDAGAVEVRLGADFEQQGFDKYDRALEAARRHKAIKAELGADVDTAAFDAYERKLAQAEGLAKRRKAFKAALGADYDSRAFKEYERALDKARHERDVKKTLKLDVDQGGFGGWIRNLRTARGEADGFSGDVRRLGLTLRGIGWGALAASIGPLIAGLGALGAAAIEAVAGLAPLGGVLATLPQFAAAAGQGLGVLALAGTGVVQTLKAMQAVDKGASQASQSHASARRSAASSITSAQRSVADATRGVHDAQLQLTDAERQARFARQDLTKAEKDAGEQLKQLKFQAKDAALAEAGASLTLAEARDHLRQVQEDPNATAFDVADARQQLAEAKQARTEAIDQSKQTQKAFDEAKRKGKGQLPDVVNARRQYQAAERSVQQAVSGVTQAELQQRRASQDLAKARTAATASTQKQTAAQSEYQRQLKQLDPAARAFVLRLKELEGTGLSLTHAAQAGFFPGALKGLNSALPLLGRARTAIHDTAQVMGDLTAQAGKFLGSRAFGRDFTQITQENAVLIDRAGQAGGHLFKALTNLTIAAQPLTDWISKLVLGWTQSIDAMTAAGRANGTLAKFFRETKHVIQDVVGIVEGLGGALVGVFKAAYPFGRQMLDGLAKSAGKLNDLVNSVKGQNALRDFFKNAQAPLHELWLLLGDLAKAIGKLFDKRLMDALTTILHALRTGVLPALSRIAHDLGTTVVPAAAKAIGAIGKLLKDLAPGLKPLFDVLAKLIGVFTDAVKFADKLTKDLPGVLKLLPALGLAGVTFGGWKLLLGFIATAKTRLKEMIGLEAAAGSGAGGGGAGGAGGGGSRIGRIVRSLPFVGVAAATIGPELVHVGTDIGRRARDTNSLGLPGSGGFLGGAARSVFQGTGLGLADPEKAMRHFGDTARTTLERLKRLGDGRGIENLARQAEDWARKEPKYADAFLNFADTARKAARDVGGGIVARLEREIASHKFATEPAIFKQIRGEFDKLSPQARIAGAKSMIDLSRSLEVQGRLPKGSTNALIKDLVARYNDLVPALRTSGHNSMTALNREFRDKKVVQSVKQQIDDIESHWLDAPKLAKTNATNARQNWLKEMDFLRQKLHETHGRMHDQAKQDYERLAKLGPAAAKQEKDEMLRTSSDLRGKWKDGLDKLVGATANSCVNLVGTIGDGMKGVEKTLNGAIKGLGLKPISFGIGSAVHSAQSSINAGVRSAIGKAEGGWIGSPGQRGQDEIPMFANAGDAILNGQQQDVLNLGFMRMGMGPMFARGGRLARLVQRASGGRVPIMAGLGEFHATPEMYPMLDMASQAATGGGLDHLFGEYNTPHWAYSRGGRTQRRAGGGYVYPVPGFTFAGVDEGVDFSGAGNIGVIGNAKFLRVAGQHSGTGWPGAGDGGHGNNGAMITYQLLDGPRKGRIVYTAENIDPLRGLHSGVTLGAGAAFAHARGAFPYLETGWSDAHGTPLAHGHYVNHQPTPEGQDFWAFLQGLAKGKISGGVKGGVGAVVAAVWKALKTPGLTGPDGVLKGVGQGTLDKVVQAANKYGRSQVGKVNAKGATTTGGIPSGKSGQPWMTTLRQIAKQKGWSVADWLWIIQHESSGNINARNGQYYGLGQLGSAAQASYGGGPGSTGSQEIVAMAKYIIGHGYGNPTAARHYWESHSAYASGGYVNPIRGGHARRGQIDAGVDYTGSGPLSAIGNAVVRLVRPYGSSSHWTDPSGHKGGFVRYQLSDGPRQGNHVYYAEHLDPLVRQGQRVSPGQRVAHFGAKHGDSNIVIGWAAKHGEGSLALASGQGVGHTTGAGWNFNQFIKALGASPTGFVMSGGIHGSTRVGGRGVTRGSPGSPGGKGPTGPVSASGKHSYVDGNFVTWRYATQKELDEWYGKAKTKGGKKKSGGNKPGNRGGLNWHRMGATVDPTHGNPGLRGSWHGGMSYAELLEAGANRGLHRFDMAHTLGVHGVTYGLPDQYPVWVRNPGSRKAIKVWKNDVGSGQGGNKHYKIDLHLPAARALGHGVQNFEVDVASAKARGGFLGRAVQRFAGGGRVHPPGSRQPHLSPPQVRQPRHPSESGGRNQANIPIASMGSAETHWGKGIKKYTDEAARLERIFSRSERELTREDSRLEYVTSPADGSPAHINQAAIDQHTRHLNHLIGIKDALEKVYGKLRHAIWHLRKAYRDTITKLHKQLKFITSKLRRTAVRSQIKTYQDRLATLDQDWQTADDNWWSAGQDKLDLIQERDVLAPDAQKQVSDAGPGADLQAQLDQAKAQLTVLQEATRIQEGTIATFRSPGDIGIGAPSAYAAAFDLPGVGQGNVYGGANPYATLPGGGQFAVAGGAAVGGAGVAGGQALGGLAPGMYVLKIDDPAGQKVIAAAGNAGNGYQNPRPSSLEIPGL
jgi:hypothetical protein